MFDPVSFFIGLFGGMIVMFVLCFVIFMAFRRIDQTGEIRSLFDRLILANSSIQSQMVEIKALRRYHYDQQETFGRVIAYLKSQPPRIGDREFSGILDDVEKAYQRGESYGE